MLTTLAPANAVVAVVEQPGVTCGDLACQAPATVLVSLPVTDEPEPVIVSACWAHGITLALDWTEQ
jgi:hypothetical protein